MRGTKVVQTWQWNPALYAPVRWRKACRYEAFIPAGLHGFAEPLTSELAAATSDAESALHRLNQSARPALAPLARLLLRTESIASSKVEGMQINARDLARAESKLEAGRKVGPTVQEILSNIDAMELAIHRATKAESFSIEDILAIHRALMSSAPNSQITDLIRKEQNWIGGNDYNPCGANYVGPPPEYVPSLLDDLCRAINEDALPPVFQAALIHAQFEAIHPFHDCNGRTGRALIHVVLRRRGLTPQYVPPISVVLAARKDQYVRGLSAFTSGDITSWATIFADACAESARLAIHYLDEVGNLQNLWRSALREFAHPRTDSVTWKLIDVLPAYPIINVGVAVALTGRTKAVVSDAMTQLELAGVLIRATEGKRNRTWESAGLLELITDLENGLLPN
jgi:Fic family protein